ncbi:unnamed protein product [[Candida] boidinii]|nr:unnamed protein product [[Candida] boidinii]
MFNGNPTMDPRARNGDIPNSKDKSNGGTKIFSNTRITTKINNKATLVMSTKGLQMPLHQMKKMITGMKQVLQRMSLKKKL